MHSKSGSYKFHIESYLCDFNGDVRLPLIGNYILHAATIHAQERGFGYDMIIKDNCAWVLSRMAVEIYEYPKHEDDLIVETWVEDVTRFFTQRCFRFLNQHKKVIGYARTIWAAINIDTRRPIDISTWRSDIFDYTDNTIDCPIEKPSKLLHANDENLILYVVKYSDIDINKHMNSVRYMEHNIDLFDLSMFNDKNIRRFEIMYLTESNFGDNLSFHKQEVNPNEFLIETKKGDISVCRSRVVWAFRNQII